MMPHLAFLGIVVVSTLADALIMGASLFWPGSRREPGRPRTIGLGRLMTAVAITALVFLVKLVPLERLGFKPFGMLHLVYIDLVVLVPAVGLGLLVASKVRVGNEPWRSPTLAVRLASAASLLLIPIGIDASWIEPFRLRLETAEVAVSPDRAGKDVIRIGVLSDLQTARVTDYEREAVARLLAEKPDLILVPGDVFQGRPDEFEANREALRDLLARLSAPGGVYLVLGDVDRQGRYLREVLHETSIRQLDDEVVKVRIGDRLVTIGGVGLDYASTGARAVARRLEDDEGYDDIRILFAHRPDVALGLRRHSRVDLVVAGHTHGGQIVVPGFGPPMTLTNVPRRVAAGGLHAIEGNPIYVSRGVGCERGQAPRIRFLCPPEISLLSVGVGQGPDEEGLRLTRGFSSDRSGR